MYHARVRLVQNFVILPSLCSAPVHYVSVTENTKESAVERITDNNNKMSELLSVACRFAVKFLRRFFQVHKQTTLQPSARTKS